MQEYQRRIYVIEKFLIKHPYVIMVVVVVSLATILIVLFTNTEEKTPATSDQVSAELVELGYDPVDLTDYYGQFFLGLKRAVSTQTPNIRFYFFELNNNDNSWAVYGKWQSQIYQTLGGVQNESSEHYYNYVGYYVYNNDMYYHLVWVDNTVVFVYCDKNYKSDIFKILEAIGY